MKRISVVKDLENIEHNEAIVYHEDYDNIEKARAFHGIEIDGPCELKYEIDERFFHLPIVWLQTEEEVTTYAGNILRNLPPLKHFIHVDKDAILYNNWHMNSNIPKKPVCNIDATNSCMELNIKGPSRVIYSPNKPHKNGYIIWIETDSEIEIVK